MRPLVDVIEHELEENAKHNRNREEADKPLLSYRTQAGLIAHVVEVELKKAIADQVWNLLFPSPPSQ